MFSGGGGTCGARSLGMALRSCSTAMPPRTVARATASAIAARRAALLPEETSTLGGTEGGWLGRDAPAGESLADSWDAVETAVPPRFAWAAGGQGCEEDSPPPPFPEDVAGASELALDDGGDG